MNTKMKMMLVGLLAVVASEVFAAPDWWSWDDGYARAFSASDIDFEYHGDWFSVPILLVPNGAEGGPFLARGDSRIEYEIPRCPFARGGYEFTGWKLFNGCYIPRFDGGTITSCNLPSGETYEWWDFGYLGEYLPGESIGKLCGGVVVLVAQWRETQVAPKYRLTVSVDPNGKGGSVSGSGTYAPGTTVTLKATPKKGYYFSEWEFLGTVDASINSWDLIKGENGMFQKPSIKVKMPKGATKIAARFVKADKDYVRIKCEFGSPWYPTGKGDVDIVQIFSAALIKSVKVVSLPKGVSFKKYDYSEYYFMVANAAQLSPGKKYTAKIVAVSTTGKSKTLTLSIRGPNRTAAVDKGVLKLDTYYDGYRGGYRLRAGTKFNWADLGISAAEGWKITKVTGLPGVKWDVAKQKMVGVPSKKGTYTVMFTVAKGQTSYTASATFKVLALPLAATGTFNGFVTWTYGSHDTGDTSDSLESYYVGAENPQLDPYSLNVKVTVSSAGKISAKVGNQSFAGTGLTFVSNGVYKATLRKSNKITSGEFKGCTESWWCAFEIDTAARWDAIQLKGVYWSLGNNCSCGVAAPGFLTAQRNPFGKDAKKKYFNKTAGAIATKFSKHGTMKTYCIKVGTGVYDLAGMACAGGYKLPLSFKISTAGKVTVTGKIGNLAVSGTTTLKIAPSTWEGSPWSPYDTKYDEETGEYRREYTGALAYQADFCLTVAWKDVHIHVEFNPMNMDCRHGWATVDYHTWDEYYDRGDSNDGDGAP